MSEEENRKRKGRRLIRNAREGVRRGYEVAYIPESVSSPSPLDLIIQRCLNNRGKKYVLMEKTSRKKSSAHSLVRRLRKRAVEGQVGELCIFVSRTFWNEGLVRVYGHAMTSEEYKAHGVKLLRKKASDGNERDERDDGAEGGERAGEGRQGDE